MIAWANKERGAVKGALCRSKGQTRKSLGNLTGKEDPEKVNGEHNRQEEG
jgi:hypothetical protein